MPTRSRSSLPGSAGSWPRGTHRRDHPQQDDRGLREHDPEQRPGRRPDLQQLGCEQAHQAVPCDRQLEERLLERRASATSSCRTMPFAAATSPTSRGRSCPRQPSRSPSARRDLDPGLFEHGRSLSACGLRTRMPPAARAASSAVVACSTNLPRWIITTSSAICSTSAEDVAGEEDRPPLGGERAKQLAEPADALRVEPVRRLVEDEHLRVAEQRAGQAEPLAHAERVPADAPSGRVREIDELEHFLHSRARDARRRREHPQVIAPRSARMEVGGLEHCADLLVGESSCRVDATHDRRPARCRLERARE